MSSAETLFFGGSDASFDKEDFNDSGNPICKCGMMTFMAEARQDTANYGRWFYRYRNYKKKPMCYFKWIDEPFTLSSQEVIGRLVAKERNMELATVNNDELKAGQHRELEQMKALLQSIRILVIVSVVIGLIGVCRKCWN